MEKKSAAVERALALARSGEFETVLQLRAALMAEGFDPLELKGDVVPELRMEIVAARKAAATRREGSDGD